jgi:hypothetical protein
MLAGFSGLSLFRFGLGFIRFGFHSSVFLPSPSWVDGAYLAPSGVLPICHSWTGHVLLEVDVGWSPFLAALSSSHVPLHRRHVLPTFPSSPWSHPQVCSVSQSPVSRHGGLSPRPFLAPIEGLSGLWPNLLDDHQARFFHKLLVVASSSICQPP